MKTRAEAVRLIEKQMSLDNSSSREKGRQWHYGIQELRDLLDFIYEEEPKSDDEKLRATSGLIQAPSGIAGEER